MREHFEIHDTRKARSNGREAQAAVLIGHENALSVPVVPVHDVFENGHSKRV